MLLLAGLALLGFPLVLLPFRVLLSFSRPSGLGFLDSYKIKLFELFADGRVLDANKCSCWLSWCSSGVALLGFWAVASGLGWRSWAGAPARVVQSTLS